MSELIGIIQRNARKIYNEAENMELMKKQYKKEKGRLVQETGDEVRKSVKRLDNFSNAPGTEHTEEPNQK